MCLHKAFIDWNRTSSRSRYIPKNAYYTWTEGTDAILGPIATNKPLSSRPRYMLAGIFWILISRFILTNWKLFISVPIVTDPSTASIHIRLPTVWTRVGRIEQWRRGWLSGGVEHCILLGSRVYNKGSQPRLGAIFIVYKQITFATSKVRRCLYNVHWRQGALVPRLPSPPTSH